MSLSQTEGLGVFSWKGQAHSTPRGTQSLPLIMVFSSAHAWGRHRDGDLNGRRTTAIEQQNGAAEDDAGGQADAEGEDEKRDQIHRGQARRAVCSSCHDDLP